MLLLSLRLRLPLLRLWLALLLRWPLLRAGLLPGAKLVGFALIDLWSLFRRRSLPDQRVLRSGYVLTTRGRLILGSFRGIRARSILWFRPLRFRTIRLGLPFPLVLLRRASRGIRAWNVCRLVGS